MVTDTIYVTKVLSILGASAGRKHWSLENNLKANGDLKNVLLLDCFFQKLNYTKWKEDADYKSNLMLNANKRLTWPY